MKIRYILSSIVLCLAAFAFSACETDEKIVEKVGDMITTITTGAAAPTAITASLSGTVADLSSVKASTYTVGFVVGTSQDVTATGQKTIGSFDPETGAVTATVSGLKEGTTYYYAVFATLQNIVTQYGDVKSFTATDAAILTNEATEVAAVKAILNGQASGVGSDLGAVKLGFKLSDSEENVTSSVHDVVMVEAVAGTFDYTFKGLLPEHTYYYVAYAVIDGNIQYGEPQSFTTQKQEMEWVDLGLDVLWAKYNVGADSESEIGAVIGYGDITGLETATTTSAYIAETVSETENDIALSVFGSTTAEMNYTPTEADFKQLIAGTTQSWEEVGGVKGIRFTAKNGNSIFLPAAGLRQGTESVDQSDLYYWSGEIYSVNSAYAKAVVAKDGESAEVGISRLFTGMPVRPVQRVLECQGLPVKNGNLVQGDLEGKGNYRLEIYNAYGATAESPVVDPSLVKFQNNLKVTFTITGVPDGKPYEAYFAFASSDWGLQHWSYKDASDEYGTASCLINGDGTYSLTLHGAAEGVTVFCIDINELGADAPEGVFAKIDMVEVDVIEDFEGIAIKQNRIVQGDLEGKGTYRVEIYNEYGSTKENPPINPEDIYFKNDMRVVFTISGLPEGCSYPTNLSFADASWDPNNWDFNEDGNASCVITGNGTYTLDFNPMAEGEGAMVFCIDIPGLATDIPEGVFVTVDEISFDHFLKNPTIKIDNSKIVEGDIEGKGTYRAEIFNEYGASKADPAINPEDINFSEVMRVIFTISGISNAEKEYQAYIAYADQNWGASNWGFNENGNGSCIVTGDGTYTLDLATGPGQGAMVFCIDVPELATDTPEGVDINVDKIIMDPDDTHEVMPESGKVLFINKDGDETNARIEIYNEYGASKANPAINTEDIQFSKNMAVTFTIKGIDGNLVEGAEGKYIAGLSYADASWDPSYWSSLAIGKYETVVNGDGTYTVWMETETKAEGAVVFCVEIGNLWKDLVDASLIEVSVDAIIMDAPFTYNGINHDLVEFQNKDGNGVDGRIEIYNEYSNSGSTAPQYYNDKLCFSGLMAVTYTIEGIDGNLVEGASAEYKSDLSFADASWDPSSWGTDYGFTTVTGDGKYTVYAVLEGKAEGAVVWTVELYDLWKDLVDPEAVSVTINKVVIPGLLSPTESPAALSAKGAKKVIYLNK